MKNDIINKINNLFKEGIYVPREDMIHDDNDILKIKEVCDLNIKVLDYAISLVEEGISTLEINDKVYEYIKSLGCESANIIEGYTNAICISLNDCLCHGIGRDDVFIKKEDVVKIDCAIYYNGYYADACRTISLSKNKEIEDLINASLNCIKYAIDKIVPYKSYIGDIGFYINEYLSKKGYTVISEVTGHGVGLEYHCEPLISYNSKKGTDFLIVPNMIFTIEPIVLKGLDKMLINEEDPYGFYSYNKVISSQFEFMVLVLDDKIEIICR